MAQIGGKCTECTEWPQNDLHMFKVKYSICILCFDLREPFLELLLNGKKCTKWPEMTLTLARSKVPICIPNTRHFPPCHSKIGRFFNFGPILGKCTKWPQKDFDVFKVKEPICTPHALQNSSVGRWCFYILDYAIQTFGKRSSEILWPYGLIDIMIYWDGGTLIMMRFWFESRTIFYLGLPD